MYPTKKTTFTIFSSQLEIYVPSNEDICVATRWNPKHLTNS